MKGILFKPDNIKAIVEGRKSQTRRVMQNQPYDMDKVYEKAFRKDFGARKPRYHAGEVVYIKETFCEECDGKYSLTCFKDEPQCSQAKWKSPLFLKEQFARYFIRIIDVRVERLLEITEDDAIKEGVTRPPNYSLTPHYREWFKYLWNGINKSPYDWNGNPFVFVYSFERTEKEKDGMKDAATGQNRL